MIDHDFVTGQLLLRISVLCRAFGFQFYLPHIVINNITFSCIQVKRNSMIPFSMLQYNVESRIELPL